jgi:hypothetical protein
MSLNKKHTILPEVDKTKVEKYNTNPKQSAIAFVFFYFAILFAIMCTFHAFSQPKTIQYPSVTIINADTLIVFKIEQAKQLSIWNEERKECLQISSLLNKEIVQKDIIIQTLESKNENLNGIQKRYDLILVEKDQLQLVCEGEKKLLTDEIKKQKRHKIIGIIVGSFTTAIISYFYIVK